MKIPGLVRLPTFPELKITSPALRQSSHLPWIFLCQPIARLPSALKAMSHALH